MDYIIPAMLVKKITFRRLSNPAVKEYQIFGNFPDDTYASGIRTELLDTIPNPKLPESVIISRIKLDYNQEATWKLPADIYLDRDYQFRLYVNGFILPTSMYQYNRLRKMVTIDHLLKPITVSDLVEMEYYRDLITRSYPLESDCTISIKPVFTDDYSYGTHNVII